MENDLKSPDQSDEFNVPEQPKVDESIEQFEQSASIDNIQPESVKDIDNVEKIENIDQIESMVEPELNIGSKIDVVRPTRPTEPIMTEYVENVMPAQVETDVAEKTIISAPKNDDKKPAKKGFAKKLLMIIVVLALMAGSAAVAYWWRDTQANEFQKTQADAAKELQKQVADLTADLDGSTDYIADNGDTSTFGDDRECLPVAPAQSAIDNIKGVITTANTEPLQGYVSDSASVVTVDAGSASSSPSNGAMSSVTSFLESSSRVWDFNLSDLLVDSYKAGEFGQYFDDAMIIGKSADGEVIAITFDCNSKINDILVSTNEAGIQ